ncbi:MAG: phosphoglycerate dehydrogenase [Rhizobacter sp.]|nr:phosphoglycerate dehydrogenase [Rhizobacter sp.]
MDLLIVEPLDVEVLTWLQANHSLRYAPELAGDAQGLLDALSHARAVIIPSQVRLDASTLAAATALQAVGRIGAGAENIDLAACARRGIEVVRSTDATAQAEAEFMIGALLALLRRVPVEGSDGLPVGRELAGSTVGVIGMSACAQPLARLLSAFGSRVVGYDPTLHGSDGLFGRWSIEPIPLSLLFEECDAVCVCLAYFNRYRGLLGERLLELCKPNQVLVSITQSAVFEEVALAEALDGGRLAAAWLDSVEPGLLMEGRPLHGVASLQVTQRLASTTRESRLRSAWAVARRIDQVLSAGSPRDARTSADAA